MLVDVVLDQRGGLQLKSLVERCCIRLFSCVWFVEGLEFRHTLQIKLTW